MTDTEKSITGTSEETQVGAVYIVHGTVKAVSTDGAERILTASSPVYAGDHIVTVHDGMVSIIFADAAQTRLDAGRDSNITLSEDVYQGSPPEDISEVNAPVEEIQKALLLGGGGYDFLNSFSGEGETPPPLSVGAPEPVTPGPNESGGATNTDTETDTDTDMDSDTDSDTDSDADNDDGEGDAVSDADEWDLVENPYGSEGGSADKL